MNLLQQALRRVTVESVLDRLGVSYVRKGNELQGRCPVHERLDGNESKHHLGWSVHAELGVYHCFSGSHDGDLITLVKLLMNLGSDRGAYEWIVNGASFDPDLIVRRIERIVHENRAKTADVFTYVRGAFESGGLEPETVSWLARWNITRATAERFGCVTSPYETYRDRLLFPVRHFRTAAPSGFVATLTTTENEWRRSLVGTVDPVTRLPHTSDSVRRHPHKKVLYSPGLKMSERLLGERGLAPTRNGSVIVVEGCRDVMRLRQDGLPAVGLGGKSMSDWQLILARRLGARRLVIMLDGDDAGREGAAKIARGCVRWVPAGWR